MSTQYDSIAAQYHSSKNGPCGRLEVHNLELAIRPHIRRAKVLDLACGTGFYSKKFLEWGAASVTGIDVSAGMIRVAREILTPGEIDHISYEVADGGVATSYPGGPFDVVVGVWFLNYASDATRLTQMCANISQNLRSGGLFLGIYPYVTNDVEAWVQKMEASQNHKFNVQVFKRESIDGGIKEHVKILGNSQATEFDCYHLQQQILERSARQGGLSGALEMFPLDFPEMQDLPDTYWDGYMDAPRFTVFSLRR